MWIAWLLRIGHLELHVTIEVKGDLTNDLPTVNSIDWFGLNTFNLRSVE